VSVRAALLALLTCAGLGACTLFERETPVERDDSLAVVDDEGPFDPSEAVDDDDDADANTAVSETDDADAIGARSGEEIDERTASKDERRHEREPPSASDQDPAAGNEQTEEKEEVVAEDLSGESAEEDVAAPDEVENLERARERAERDANRSSGDDEERKKSIATNPEPGDPGAPESGLSSLVDVLGELAILIVLAIPLTLVAVGLHRRPLATIATLAATVAAGWLTFG
jgi:hypothetical protein